MITFRNGDIFEARTDAIVNTVNLVGVMGKGLALQFKERFKDNFKVYKKACQDHTIAIGQSLVVPAMIEERPVLIINFPTKLHWRNPSQYEYIARGLDNLVDIIREYNINSIAIPPLGAGNGGLDWATVKQMIVDRFTDVPCEIVVYEPGHVASTKRKEIGLTPGRALLLYMLNRMQQEGCDVTQFSAVKAVYFLQKFGAEPFSKLLFQKHYYGPYSVAVGHVLHALDGAYVRGFSDMSKKPFEPFGLIEDKIPEVITMVENDKELSEVALRTCRFLDGYWNEFSLELLSSVDFIMTQYPDDNEREVYDRLCAWSPRKRKLFSDPCFAEAAYKHLRSALR